MNKSENIVESRDRENRVHSFSTPISHLPIPMLFTYPFNYEAHPLAEIAKHELIQYLQSDHDWKHNFGLSDENEVDGLGKMFGVLVVRQKNGTLGFLTGFSGILAGKTDIPYFVPPLHDRFNHSDYYKEKEAEIDTINASIDEIKSDSAYLKILKDIEDYSLSFEKEREERKKGLKEAKKNRDLIRKSANGENPELLESLRLESINSDMDFKRWVKSSKKQLEDLKLQLDTFVERIENLKQERKQKSNALQNHLFDQYQFLNINGDVQSLRSIFTDSPTGLPPAGAGECAAPKMLQYAFKNDLEPICMAEFWWGKSPKLEIRKHNHFYPACKSKCEPILGHMLQGMKMDENPIEQALPDLELTTLYEDEHILVVNKPSGLLSVPGKRLKDSVFTRIKELYPHSTGPLLTHRLDMSTSGILLLSKSLEIHRPLQKQFTDRTVKKEYTAVLDGEVATNEGTINLPIRVDLDNRPMQMVCYEHGKTAKTYYRLISRSNGDTRILFQPHTGRTHQLRVHAAHIDGLNAPIKGDDLYGTRNKRLLLHASRLEFIHPVSGEQMIIECEPDF